VKVASNRTASCKARHNSGMALLLSLLLAVSGLHGVVTRGPVTPVCRVGTPCTAPAVGTVLVFSHDGRVAARARTRAGGRYSVRLAAGFYAVSVSPPQQIGGLRPSQVRVRSGASRRIDFAVDTGIR
jgi:hypothetical protein